MYQQVKRTRMLGEVRQRLDPCVLVGVAVELVKAAVERAHNVGDEVVIGISVSLEMK